MFFERRIIVTSKKLNLVSSRVLLLMLWLEEKGRMLQFLLLMTEAMYFLFWPVYSHKIDFFKLIHWWSFSLFSSLHVLMGQHPSYIQCIGMFHFMSTEYKQQLNYWLRVKNSHKRSPPDLQTSPTPQLPLVIVLSRRFSSTNHIKRTLVTDVKSQLLFVCGCV